MAAAPERSNVEVVVTNAGFAITPPPGYEPMETGEATSRRAQWKCVKDDDTIALLTVSRTGTRMPSPDGRKLLRIAEQLTKQSVPRGAEAVCVSARSLPEEHGRKHVETYRSYVEGLSRQHSIFRFLAERDGEIIMIAISTSQDVPESELEEQAELVASSFRRLGDKRARATKKWWQIF